MSQIDVDHLKREIETAFSDVPYPGDDHLITHQCDECETLLKTLRSQHWKDWKDRPLEILRKNDGYQHNLLTPEANRFFYPLFMFAILNDFDGADVFRHAGIIMFLSPRRTGELNTMNHSSLNLDNNKKRIAEFEAFVKGFSNRQIAVIRDFLLFLKKEHPTAVFVVEDIDAALKSIADIRGNI